MLQGCKAAIGPDGLGFDEMVSVSENLILADTETVATALSGMLYYLLREPSCLVRLTDEIRSSFQNENEINMNCAAPIRYLIAVLEESTRLYPPVPAALPRMVPEPGQIICDKFVPAGNSAGFPLYSVITPLRTSLSQKYFIQNGGSKGKILDSRMTERMPFIRFQMGLGIV